MENEKPEPLNSLWRKNLTPREYLEKVKKTPPHIWTGAFVGTGLSPFLNHASDTTLCIVGCILLVISAFVVAHVIKFRKKMKRAQCAATGPETA
jgi:hypothetical protein